MKHQRKRENNGIIAYFLKKVLQFCNRWVATGFMSCISGQLDWSIGLAMGQTLGQGHFDHFARAFEIIYTNMYP